jgi:magnesium chelatase family protein
LRRRSNRARGHRIGRAIGRRARAGREQAHARQHARQRKPNARLTAPEVAEHCHPTAEAETLLAHAMARLSLSARAYHRILKVARTIADLAGSVNVTATHVAEAIQLRRFGGAI